MPDDHPRKWVVEDQTAARLVQHTGISREQAEDLIILLGLNWASLMREAKQIAKNERLKYPNGCKA